MRLTRTLRRLTAETRPKVFPVDALLIRYRRIKGPLAAVLGLFMFWGGAKAADLSLILPSKAPRSPSNPYEWTGYYVGGHESYALGGSNWSLTQAGLPVINGSLNFSNAYNFSTGAGSYSMGFQAGYNYLLKSRWLLGAETDVSFPSFVGGSRTFTSTLTGQANYLEQVEFAGTVRGRIGYAPGHWLFYATGGLAWSYEQFSRTQLAGTPVGGTSAAAGSHAMESRSARVENAADTLHSLQ